MHKVLPGVALSIVLGFIPWAAQAEDLSQVYALAYDSDPQLQQADAARRAEREAKPQAISALLPQLDARASHAEERFDTNDRKTDHFDRQSYDVSLVQSVYDYANWVNLRIADADVAAAEARYSSAEQDLIIRTAEAYFAVLAAEDNLRFATAERESTGRQLEQTQQRFDVGLSAITDVHEAQAAYDTRRADEIEAQNILKRSREALREITGVYLENIEPLQAEIPLLHPEPADIDQWTDTAVRENLDVVAARFDLDSARDQVKVERSGHYPTLDLIGQRDWQDQGGGFFGNRRTTADSIRLQVNVPILQGGFVLSRTREAAHRLDQSQQVVEEERRAALRGARDAYLRVIDGISRVQAFEQALISSRSALEATEAGYEVGTRTIVDVLNVQSALFANERDYAGSRYDYILDTLRLKQQAGILHPKDVQRVNAWLSAEPAPPPKPEEPVGP